MSTIKFKNSSVAAQTPTSGDLAYGELAINTADDKIFYKDASDAIRELVGPNMFNNLPTSDPSVSGRLFNDAGTLKISTGGTPPPSGSSTQYDVNNYYFYNEVADTNPISYITEVVWDGVQVYYEGSGLSAPSTVNVGGITYNEMVQQSDQYKSSVERVVP
jgi:hypothetical protein